MATIIQIIRPRDIVRATAEGTIDRRASEQQIAELVAATRELSDFDVIIDTRNAEVNVSDSDLWDLAVTFSRFPEMRRRRIAILPSDEGFDRAAYFALVAENRGTQIKPFDTFEAAINWFVKDRTEIAH